MATLLSMVSNTLANRQRGYLFDENLPAYNETMILNF